MNAKPTQPTQEQCEQALVVQRDFDELINRLLLEGIDVRVIMAGLSASTSGLLTTTFGAGCVPHWYEVQARVAADVLRA